MVLPVGRTQVGSSELVTSPARCPRRRASRALVIALVLAGLAPACGGASGDSLYGGPGGSGGNGAADAGAGGTSVSSGGASGGARSTGGRAGTGGARPSTGGRTSTGGTASGGGAASNGGGSTDTGGSAGSGGTADAGAEECEAPGEAGHTALCVHFIPERVRARQEKTMDKMGALAVQIFDGPKPASATKLAEQLLGTNGEISVDDLPVVRFDETLPDTVYLRAVFVDNPSALAPNGAGFGVWIGGADLSNGLDESQPILPLSLTQGAAQDVDLALVATRRLEVTLSVDVKPLGDGEGPLLVTALRTATPASDTPYFGIAGAACIKADNPLSVTGYVIGSGLFYVGALLNDLGASGTFPPGSLISIDTSGGGSGALSAKVTVNPQEYSVAVKVPLNALIPMPSDPVIPANSCADLGL